ncbi:balbiani ring protein 3-like [Xenia sp. Carnegie-2017]|uniref:balbiani ring protein 3-like n=1 Tax=Xenia sp. Carnegie-2017 TaxID=2897299 RepID=UPI001F046F56|nr:balbiani ring protein 3-like [Xenia sp. Carnegie-2017]
MERRYSFKRGPPPANQTKIGVILPAYFCQLTEVPVKVPFPAVFPKYVKLWRCMGTSYAPLTHECVVKKMTQFWLKTLLHLIRMTNHTQCGDRCIFNKDNCNLTTHTFDPASCLCKCRTHVQFSCGFGKMWDVNDCACKCKKPPSRCIGFEDKKEWNDRTCRCECTIRRRKLCQNAGFGKVIDNNTCECKCPRKTCPRGLAVSPRNCQCTAILSSI